MADNERTITIDGVEYKESELSTRLLNIISIRSEIQVSKTRHELELEKIDVLTKYYNGKIKEELEQLDKKNGGSS
tara:strand:+ start:192 stop:416 length:225 start_codon:yes stop_codon:yes gene_type:complete